MFWLGLSCDTDWTMGGRRGAEGGQEHADCCLQERRLFIYSGGTSLSGTSSRMMEQNSDLIEALWSGDRVNQQ